MASPSSPNAARDPFAATYHSLYDQAVRTAQSVLGDAAAAEDVVQDVFLELWRTPNLYDSSRGSMRSYVMMLARSRALDRWRTRAARERAAKRAMGEAEAAAPPVDEPAEAVAMRRGMSREILEVLGRLPAPQREAILLSYGAGLSSSQVAQATDIPLGTAKSRIRCGLRRMRSELREDEEDLSVAA